MRAWLFSWLLRLVARTWRVRWLGRDRVARLRSSGCGVVFALWHGRSLLLVPTHLRDSCSVLVSRSRDGDQAASLLKHLGYDVVRGSTSRGGAHGLRGLWRQLANGRTPCFAVDGPRGPAGSVAPGAVGLAALADAAVVPVAAGCVWGASLRSWDRALIPAPGTDVVVAYGRPLRMSRERDRGEANQVLQKRLVDLHRRVDRLSSRGVEPGSGA